jgi:hypothetical protein
MIPTPEERPTVSVEEAGQWLGLGRSSAYEAARRGEIPTLRFNRTLRVPTARLRVLLGIDTEEEPPTPVIPLRRRLADG